MSKSCVAVLFSLTIVRTFLRKAFTAFFDGFISNFPLYFRMFCPRKSKPSLICVITVFSSESCRPRSARKSLISGITSLRKVSGLFPVTIKSSAYRTKLIWSQMVLPATVRLIGNLSFRIRSRPSKVMFIKTGDIVPPCGVPSSVGKIFLVSTKPHFSHFSSISLSIGIFFINQL